MVVGHCAATALIFLCFRLFPVFPSSRGKEHAIFAHSSFDFFKKLKLNLGSRLFFLCAEVPTCQSCASDSRALCAVVAKVYFLSPFFFSRQPDTYAPEVVLSQLRLQGFWASLFTCLHSPTFHLRVFTFFYILCSRETVRKPYARMK